MSSSNRWAWVEVDLNALRGNVAALLKQAGKAELWATVKANAYGHGAIEVAQVARAAGARGLCVALADEAHQLRLAEIDGPILVVSEQPATQHEQMLRDDLSATLYNESTINDYAHTAARLGLIGRVHLKVDTGMHRVGVRVEDALARAQQIRTSPSLHLEGVYTHFAAADLPQHNETQKQLIRFRDFVATLDQHSLRPQYVHTANSSGALRLLDPTTDIVRVGIAMYGIAPSNELETEMSAFKPVLSLHARVSHVQHLAAGEGVSYGLRHKLDRASTIATLPLGYGDGIPRRLWSTGGEVLIFGKRCPIIGVVTMDQLMINCGNASIAIGDEAVLIGAQGNETITANQIATKLDTIGYEIVCGLNMRLPRHNINTTN